MIGMLSEMLARLEGERQLQDAVQRERGPRWHGPWWEMQQGVGPRPFRDPSQEGPTPPVGDGQLSMMLERMR